MTSTPESNPNPLIWSAPATVALCVVGPIAVYAGCHRSLKVSVLRKISQCLVLTAFPQKYICFTEQAGISTDTKHKLDVSTSEPGLASEAEPVAKGKAQSALSRWVTWLKGASLVVAIFSVALGIGVGLHLLATPTILDVFWIVLMTFQTGILVSNVCRAVYSHFAYKLISYRRSTLHCQILESWMSDGQHGTVSHGQSPVLTQSHRCQIPRPDLSPPRS